MMNDKGISDSFTNDKDFIISKFDDLNSDSFIKIEPNFYKRIFNFRIIINLEIIKSLSFVNESRYSVVTSRITILSLLIPSQ